MITVQNYSNWNVYDGAAEGSGRSEKIWLISESSTTGLFKFPKIDPATSQETTEHISEHLAHQLGKILGVSTANVDIGTYHGRIGSMSYSINASNEYLIEGIGFMSGLYPNYDADQMIDLSSGKYYCLEHIFQSTDRIVPKTVWIEMMIFDFLIGNTDRHQSNWAILARFADSSKKKLHVQRCPLYDNGSSLCCYVNDIQLNKIFGKDPGPFNALVDTKSRSIIRIDGSRKSQPSHREVVKYLLLEYPETHNICKHFLKKLNRAIIDDLLNEYQAEILTPQKNKLIRQFPNRKLEILNNLINGGS